jgi:hypothetical protein
MHLHYYANMRTSLDFPDPLFRHLKTQAAMQGISLRELVMALIEKGLNANGPSAQAPLQNLPTIRLGHPMPLDKSAFSNANLSEILFDEP